MDFKACRHVIWDWNGTLLDDRWLVVEAMNILLDKRGLPRVEFDFYQRHFCFPVQDYYVKLGFDFDKEPFDVAAVEFIVEYEKRRFECRLQEGAEDGLKRVRQSGRGQAILSATQQDSLDSYVAHYGIAPYFSELIGLPDHYARSKAERGRDWLKNHHWKPEETLLIGDTLHDLETARAIGAPCVLVAQGHYSRERLEEGGVPCFNNLAELMAWAKI